MQKLLVKLKNTPGDAPQVPCSVSSALNREETLSVRGKVLSNNNPDVDQPGNRGNTLLVVFVLNKERRALMPCGQRKAKFLLRGGKAKVIRCNPFTIQLLHGSGTATQQVTLGIDAGYSHIGFSATTEKEELISGEVELRKDVSKKLTERTMYRRNKRNKLWYRELRWKNRVSSKKEGWLAPSIQHKLDSHIRLIEKIKSLLPISKIIVEVANFDTQKMENPEISGIEYQQGELQGYNIRNYLLDKFNHKCVYCGKKNIPLEIEHIVPKSRGGNNRVDNLTISCHKCNQKKGNKTAEEFGYPKMQARAGQTLKSTAFMNNVKSRIAEQLKCDSTYGYITKCNRIKLGLEKSHATDAFVIADGNGQKRSTEYIVNQIRRNNRCLQLNRKGFGPSIRRQRYNLQPHNLVRYNGQILEVGGSHCKGKRVMLSNKKSVSIENVELYNYMRGWQFFPAMNDRVSLPS